MRPLNIYLLTRVIDLDEFLNLHKQLSNLKFKINQEDHEFKTLKAFVNLIKAIGLNIEDFEGFFYSYKIPQIGKEFDLLKFNNDKCLNIELKSCMTSEEKIRDQLVKNHYYLKTLHKQIYSFTFVYSENLCFRLDEENNLIGCDIEEIISSIKYFNEEFISDINSLFKISNYLVSPINTPKSFIEHSYFLTSQQDDIKSRIMKKVNNSNTHNFISIKGSPGTGKTLLVYDIARELSTIKNILLIHCGIKSEGQKQIEDYYSNIHIIVPKEVNDDFKFEKYDIIIIDEVQRIYISQFESICNAVKDQNKICIFSSDKHQILSQSEQRRAIWDKIDSLENIEQYQLSEKIRTNSEMASFIRKVRNININEIFDSHNIEVIYADNYEEAKDILDYYKNRKYTFINFSRSNYNYSPYSKYEYDYDTHHVIGQEFDNVVMILDKSFYYNEKNILCAVSHPNPNYLYTQLLYQGITRVRERLTLIILDNKDLYDKIISIL